MERTGRRLVFPLLVALCLMLATATEQALANEEQDKRAENLAQGPEEDKRSPYAKHITSKDDKRSPYAQFLTSNADDEASPDDSIMESDEASKRSPYARFIGSGGQDKRSPYAKIIGQSSDDKRSPYARFMGSFSNDDKRSSYASFLGANSDEKRSPYARFISENSEDKRSPYGPYIGINRANKRSPYAKYLGQMGDKRSPYGPYMSMMSDNKRSPYAKYMPMNRLEKKSPGFRKMYLGGDRPRSIYDVDVEKGSNSANTAESPEAIEEDGLMKPEYQFVKADNSEGSDEDSSKERGESSLKLPPAMMQDMLGGSDGKDEGGKDSSQSRMKRSALVFDKRTPNAGFKNLMGVYRETHSSLLGDGSSSDLLVRKRRSAAYERDIRSPGYRSLKLDFPYDDDLDKRGPGFRFMKWRDDESRDGKGDKRSPGFRYMRFPDRSSRFGDVDRYQDDVDDAEMRSPGFRSDKPQDFDDDVSNDLTRNEISKRYLTGKGFLHPAAYHKQMAYYFRGYRG